MCSGLLRATGAGQESCAEVSRCRWGLETSSPDPSRSVCLGTTVLPSARALPQAASAAGSWCCLHNTQGGGSPPCCVWVLPHSSSSSRRSAVARCFLPRCVAAWRLWKLSAFYQSPQSPADPLLRPDGGSDGQCWCRQFWRWDVKQRVLVEEN